MVIGAGIGFATSLVVLSFREALSPYFAFLVLVGVGLWLRDVSRSPTGSRGPNWRSFLIGCAVWVALAIGALLFDKWLASVPASAATPSLIGAGLLVLGIACVAVGVYGFRGHPSKRLIENWAQLDGYMSIFGMFSAALPIGTAFIILAALALFSPLRPLAPLLMIPFIPLVFAGIVLMVWQPRWTKPRWLRSYEDDSRSEALEGQR